MRTGSWGLVYPLGTVPAGSGGAGGGGFRVTDDAASGISGGALFGGTSPLVAQEPRLGRTLAIVRVYGVMGQPFVPPRKIMSAGTTLLVSLDSPGPSYASIAAGRYDGTILAYMRAVNAAAYQYHLGAIFFSFQHEPEDPQHIGLGSGPQFVQAWDHVHQLAESAHLDWNDGGRLHWVLIMMHQSYAPHGAASSYWPGASEVDIIAADGYNSYYCKMARLHQPLTRAGQDATTPAWAFDPAVDFARAHGGLPVFAAEWGSDTTPAGIQATFIGEMASYMAANPEILAALYWDQAGVPTKGITCNYTVDNIPASVAALAAMGHSPAMQGTITPAG